MRNALGLMALLLLGFAIFRFGGARPVDQAILQLGVAGLLLLWVGLIWLDPRAVPGGLPAALMIAVAVYGLGRGLNAEVDYIAKSDLGHFGLLLGFTLIVFGSAVDRRWQRWWVLFIVLAATGESLYALMQYVRKSGLVLDAVQPASYLGRASGTYINPNHGAWLISLGALLALPLALFSREAWAQRILCGYAAVAGVAGLVVTFSRGAWIGAGVTLAGLALWILWREKQKWLGAALLVLIVIGAGLGLDRARAVIDAQGRNNLDDIRFVSIWPAAVNVWRERPWLGVGPGHFAEHHRKYRPPRYDSQSNPVRAHNDYLNVLADWGMVGLALVIGGIISVVVPLWRRLSESNSEGTVGRNRRALLLGLGAGVIYVLTHAVADFNLYLPANGMLIAALVALVWASAGRELSKRTGRTEVSRVRLGAWSLLAVLLAGALAVHAGRRWQEARQLSAAVAARSDFETAQRHLLAASEICPQNPETAYRLGEAQRRWSTEGVQDDEAGARESLKWLQQSVVLNPRHPYYWMALGRTQHWLGDDEAARASFRRALELDPNHYRVQAHYGWFLFEMGEYLDSFRWLKRSQWLNYEENTLAKFYLPRLESRLVAAGQWPPADLTELRNANPK